MALAVVTDFLAQRTLDIGSEQDPNQQAGRGQRGHERRVYPQQQQHLSASDQPLVFNISVTLCNPSGKLSLGNMLLSYAARVF